MPKPVHLVRTLTLNMPAAAFYEVTSNTDRVDRLSGLPAAHFTMSREPGGRQALRADARIFGVPVHWYELPFEWVDNRYWAVYRIFEGVPLKWIKFRTTLTPLAANRTRVEIVADVLPTNIIGRVGAILVFGVYTLNRLARLYQRLAQRYQEKAPTVFPPALPPDLDKRALAMRGRDLRAYDFPPTLIQSFLDHLATAHDDEVRNMRPFALADQWGADRMQTLRLFLYATRAGLVDLHWDVLCPNCRVAKAVVANLADLTLEAHCDTCNIRYDVNFDEYVELRFTVNAAVRSVYDSVYCIAGPYQSRHILAQFYLQPGDRRTLALDFAPGLYRWRTRQRAERGTFRVAPSGAPSPLVVRFTEDAAEQTPDDRTLSPQSSVLSPQHSVAPGAELRFENASGGELLLIFETADWGNQGVSAALVTLLQEFRTMFSSQVLSPGLGVAVRNLTLLFSDLKDSTALYERVGDSPAYGRVRDHFVILNEAIAAHNGALVKTIGDAIMAVFSVPADAIAAALAIQAGIARYNETAPPEDHLTVKLGAHTGPCIAIAANEVLDYFGSTVNIAARAQGASVGDDLVVTERLYEDPAVQELLAGLPVESFTAELKGLAQVFTLYRVQPLAAAALPVASGARDSA